MQKHIDSVIKFGLKESALLACVAILLAGFAIANDSPRAPISSAETRFVEYSASGLQIVPASCPSTPHDGGQCSGGNACNINFAPSPAVQGEPVMLYWAAPASGSSFTLSYPGGSHGVSAWGSASVGSDQTKTYTLSYQGLSFADGTNTGSVVTVSCSATLTVCPAGYTVQNGQCVPPGGGVSCTTSSMSFNPSAVMQNQNSTLTWTIQHPGTISYPGGSFPVTQSGSGQVGANPGETSKTYTYTRSATGETCSATLTICPAGYIAQGGQCVSITDYAQSSYNSQSMYESSYCAQPNVCSSDYRRVVDGCAGATTVQTCTASQTCVNAQCVNIGATITAIPSLVKQGRGETPMIKWHGTNVNSCTVTENNSSFTTPMTSDWTCSSVSSCTAEHAHQTEGGIEQQTTYTVFCTAPSGATASATTTINVVPEWNEP